jgi:hypothetical protein
MFAARHVFSFENGDILTTMGASWFVSYSYYLCVDGGHTNWQHVSTYRNRMRTFDWSKKYHHFFFSKIAEMKEDNLSKNTLGLKGHEIKQMAKELLTKIK